jgi:alpha-glucosidase
MIVLAGAHPVVSGTSQVELALHRGFRLSLFFLAPQLARVLVTPPGGLRMPRTWSLSPELAGQDPNDGRDRLDLTGFTGDTIQHIQEDAETVTIETELMRLQIRRSPLALTWQFRALPDAPFETVLEDRKTQGYSFNRGRPGFTHFLARDAAERYYGFGEKSGDANKHGRRLRMGATDALGYDAQSSDPLYKHIPFYLTVRPDLGGRAVGLFYDNLARGAFDLGQEIDAYHGPFRSFEASDGDLDLYLIFGPKIRDVVARYTALTGRMAMPPRWTISYSGSSMQYTDAPDAEAQLGRFLTQLAEHGIPCRSFHLSSGYTLRDGRRYVFAWNRERFPEPRRLAERFAAAGVALIANVKPALLTDHPAFADVESFRGFVRDGEDASRPHIAQFWGGSAAYLDFTNPQTADWWKRHVKAALLDHGIAATWNDNNEFEIWDDEARADLAGEGAAMACLRPVQTGLMLRASAESQREHAPGKRPFLVSRSGGPGLQRYAQTWTGDNRTDWKTLRYNLRMGHGLSLSGLFNFGHDVGGFAGGKPSPELFMRWIEQGLYWPRFSIHSWKDDGSANEPWMYPELLPQVRAALHRRERLIPLLYTLLWRAHARHEPILRPLFYDFPEQAESYEEQDAFMAGGDLLVAPVVDEGAGGRAVWLPDTPGGWYDLRCGTPFASGRHETVPAPLGAALAFARAGSILPLGPSPSWENGPLTLRLFPLSGGRATAEIYDDDGDGIVDPAAPPCLLRAHADWTGPRVAMTLTAEGPRPPRWTEIRFEDERGNPIPVSTGGVRAAASLPTGELMLEPRRMTATAAEGNS